MKRWLVTILAAALAEQSSNLAAWSKTIGGKLR
jgi:hypothetical protein